MRTRSIWYILIAGLLLVLAAARPSGMSWAMSASSPRQQTVPPGPIQITLKVNLQRPNTPPPHPSWAVPVHLAFYPTDDPNTVRHEWDLTLDASGQWSGALALTKGTYDVRVKGLHTLRNVRRALAVFGPVTIDMGTLVEGDADGDNRVRASDFALLRAAYFTSEGAPGFDPRVDFDEDNRIRSSDFALLRASYFSSGDIEVGP